MGTTHQTIDIEAPADQVWQTIRNFQDLSWAPNVITNVESVGDKPGDEVGAIRVLNGVFRETLQSLDDEDKIFTYSIDDGPSPVSKEEVKNYVGRVTVRQAEQGEGTVVEWSSAWEDNDEAAAEFCHGIYVALLQDMKKSLE
jgi:carbon monoxide dehydrogenase subunit G